jgi:hypothetical protein
MLVLRARVGIGMSNERIMAEAIAHVVARMHTSVNQAQPVVTSCPICRRPNPCPLHLYAEQVDHNRVRGQ